ncbi:NUDIX hydrolase [Kitasatospora sp. NPDC001527]|uniref:NUDIX hydrolase n=1 Tax=Kitasatospora sp. NPDC001527 TaxID=3154519 RepID=UPI003318C95C
MTDTTSTDGATESGHERAETIRYTADVVAVRPDGRVLLIKRGWPPHQGLLALPGGHIDIGETSRTAAVRELHEETGVLVNATDLTLIGVYDEPDRDPRGRYVSVAYLVGVPAEAEARAGDDAASVQWIRLDCLPSAQHLAFDHDRILAAVCTTTGR